MDSLRSHQFATTLSHGISVLEAFDVDHPALTNKDLANRTGLSKATISRMTSTLQSRDFLSFDRDDGRYHLGSSALTVGYPLLSAIPVRLRIREAMKELADEFGGNVSIGMRDRARMIYVDTYRSRGPVDFLPDIGAVLPMLQTAMGRAWLLDADPGTRQQVLRELESIDPAHYRTWRGALDRAREERDAFGFCCCFGDWKPFAYAIARVLEIDGERLVLNCAVPPERFDRTAIVEVVGPRVLALARSAEAVAVASTREPTTSLRPSSPVRRDDASCARTLARGLDLMLCFQPGEAAVRHGELVRRLRLPAPTVSRLAHTLVALGYLRRDTVTGRYTPGPATLTLAHPMLASLRLRQLARPFLADIAKRFGGAASLGVGHRTTMVYVDTEWSGDDRHAPPDTGAPLPMLDHPIGRAWLCATSADERRVVLNRIAVENPPSPDGARAMLDTALAEFRARGYCASRSGPRDELDAVAVPFSKPYDSLLFVMDCTVPSSRDARSSVRTSIARALMEAVLRIECAAGMRPSE